MPDVVELSDDQQSEGEKSEHSNVNQCRRPVGADVGQAEGRSGQGTQQRNDPDRVAGGGAFGHMKNRWTVSTDLRVRPRRSLVPSIRWSMRVRVGVVAGRGA